MYLWPLDGGFLRGAFALLLVPLVFVVVRAFGTSSLFLVLLWLLRFLCVASFALFLVPFSLIVPLLLSCDFLRVD